MHSLSEEFKKQYGITQVFGSFEGGQKSVYIVEKDGQKMALKLFRNFLEREKRELDIYQKCSELPGVPKLISVETFEGKVFILEEFIDGKQLKEIMQEYLSDEPKIKVLVREICEIMRPLWDQDIVHRDLKPENIIITPEGKPIILDFGIARDLGADSITISGDMQPNSWHWASPEQLFGQKDKISYRSDFFSIGIIAHYLFCCEHPFGSSREEILKSLSDTAPISEVSNGSSLEKFFNAALKIRVYERPKDVDSLLNKLD